MQNDLLRVPPQAVEAEEGLLSACLLDEDSAAAVQSLLSAKDFYVQAHAHIFQAIKDLYAAGQIPDTITVANHLKAKKLLEACGGPSYLGRLVNEVPMAVNAPHYAAIIREKAVKRNLAASANEIMKRCYDDMQEASALIDFAESSVMAVNQENSKVNVRSMAAIGEETLEEIREKQNRKRKPGVMTGLPLLDYKLGGLQPSDLVILAARPGMGKTSLAMNIAKQAAAESTPTLVFSLEMNRKQLATRLFCADAGVDSRKCRDGQLQPEELGRITAAERKFSVYPLFIDDSPQLNVLDIRSTARRLTRESGIGLIVVDYLQLMKGLDAKRERRELEISEISRGLKALAKDLNVPVLALSQLNRQVEAPGANREPQLSHLRESGALEQDADVILFLFCHDQPEKNATSYPVKLKIAKHRSGPTGYIDLQFDAQLTLFREVTQSYA